MKIIRKKKLTEWKSWMFFELSRRTYHIAPDRHPYPHPERTMWSLPHKTSVACNSSFWRPKTKIPARCGPILMIKTSFFCYGCQESKKNCGERWAKGEKSIFLILWIVRPWLKRILHDCLFIRLLIYQNRIS